MTRFKEKSGLDDSSVVYSDQCQIWKVNQNIMLYVDSYQIADVLGCHTSTLRVLKKYTMPEDVPSKMVGASKVAPSGLRRLHGYEVNHVIAWLRRTLLPGRLSHANERELLSMARGAQGE